MNAQAFIVPLVSLFLLSCTSEREQLELLATQLNAEAHDRAYADYCSSERSKYEDFMRDLNKAAHAEFCRVRGDCCCTGAEFPPAKGAKMSKREFAELKSILSQGQPLPLKSQDDIPYTGTKVIENESGEPELSWERMSPIVPMSAGAFHIVDRLVLLDNQGKEICHISCFSGIEKSSQKPSENAVMMLPDELYERYRNLPSRQQFIRNIRKAHKGHDIQFTGE